MKPALKTHYYTCCDQRIFNKGCNSVNKVIKFNWILLSLCDISWKLIKVVLKYFYFYILSIFDWLISFLLLLQLIRYEISLMWIDSWCQLNQSLTWWSGLNQSSGPRRFRFISNWDKLENWRNIYSDKTTKKTSEVWVSRRSRRCVWIISSLHHTHTLYSRCVLVSCECVNVCVHVCVCVRLSLLILRVSSPQSVSTTIESHRRPGACWRTSGWRRILKER